MARKTEKAAGRGKKKLAGAKRLSVKNKGGVRLKKPKFVQLEFNFTNE
jgi:predicted secreted protein